MAYQPDDRMASYSGVQVRLLEMSLVVSGSRDSRYRRRKTLQFYLSRFHTLPIYFGAHWKSTVGSHVKASTCSAKDFDYIK